MGRNLRKVTFALGYKRGFEPNQTAEEQKEQEEQERERKGYFHEWTQMFGDEPRTSPCASKMGIVEDAETGKVYYVLPDLIQFNEKPNETV